MEILTKNHPVWIITIFLPNMHFDYDVYKDHGLLPVIYEDPRSPVCPRCNGTRDYTNHGFGHNC